MLFLRSFSLVAIAFSFGAVGLGARPAQAAICCTSSTCQVENPPPLCDRCTYVCPPKATAEIVYDEVELLCYVAGDLDPAASESGESAGCA